MSVEDLKNGLSTLMSESEKHSGGLKESWSSKSDRMKFLSSKQEKVLLQCNLRPCF